MNIETKNKISLLSEDDKTEITKTRKDLQIGRRAFHFLSGSTAASIYALLVTHQQAVYILGTCACLLYVLEQIRINYPEFADQFAKVTRFFLRAEEQLKESSAVPYVMALLLTILSFPKLIAISSILTLAIADPLSAIIGIRFGKRHLVSEKTLEGSLAFFLATFLCVLLPFLFTLPQQAFEVWAMAFICAFVVSAFEMLPVRIDDNLTIPLFTAFTLLMLSASFGILPLL